MITSLLVENFQKHVKKRLDLDLVTTLVGDTDSGKSSLLRALAWLCLNNYRGDGFIRKGQRHARVAARIDGKKLTRRKESGKNTYHLNKQAFQAVASSVPAEVADLLCLSQENFQEQIEGPFWFNLTPGQVSRELNAIINLEEMDRVLETLATWLRQAQAERSSTERRLEEAREKVESLAWVEEAKRDRDRILSQKEKLSSLHSQHRLLSDLIQEMWESVVFQQNAKQMILDATNLKPLVDKLDKLTAQEANLSDLLEEMGKEGKKSCHLTGEVSRLEKELAKLQKGRCPLCKQTWLPS